ncbi:MAG TPA: metallophosphoesterase family protein [Minicystis sp.]|nr:metallophosphoesterase family protein [Minicystis sp.]
MRILCLSDVHGHADALGAVLATAERRGYARIVVAGDHCFPGPAPLDTWRRLTQAGAMLAQGVGDRALATLDVGSVRARSDHEKDRLDRLITVRRELGDLILARLARLPPMLRIPTPDGGELVVVHGSPADPTEPITHDMTDQEISALLGDDPADIVVCGGSHVPFDRTVAGVRVINVGSVGEAPSSREKGALYADATFLELGPAGAPASVEQFVVPLGKAA